MNRSLKVFTIRGIDIRLHITFPLILLWAAVQFGLLSGSLDSALFGVVAISLLFFLVTLHELGHSFAAQYYGVTVKQIVLTPLGGLAQLKQIPDKPIQEFVIAVAGPAVNIVIAAFMAVLAATPFVELINPLAVLGGTGGFGLSALFSYIFLSNIALALFNLLPAFPMDGGRILRSLLAMRLPYIQATSIAAAIGRAAAIFFGVFGLLNGNFFLMLIALFIYTSAGQEAQFVQLRALLRGHKVRDYYSPAVHRLTPYQLLQEATSLSLFSGQHNFPVIQDGQLVGFLPQTALLQGLQKYGPQAVVEAVMLPDVAGISPEAGLFDAQQRLAAERLTALPVVADGRFLGLITQDHIRNILRFQESAPGALPEVQSA
jgi:Zn-dependent protease